TAIIDPAVTNTAYPTPTNIGGVTGSGDQTDFFLSYFLPFSDLVSALQTLGISGINTNSFFRYIIGTATQPNSINQDINGLSGGVNVTTNYDDIGIFTPPITPGGATNFPPVAVDDTGTTAEDVAVTFTQADLKGNDTDANNSNAQLSVTAEANPLNSAVVLNGNGTVIFPSTTLFRSSGGVNVTTNDDDIGIFTPPITPGGATNVPPVAVDDTGTTAEDVAVTFTQADLKGNDTDVDNSNAQLSVTAVSNPLNGAVVLNGNGTVTFTPAPDFNGTAGFDYTVSDGSLRDTHLVTTAVTPVN